MSKLRVLLLLHSLSLNGAPKVALDALEAMGDDVEVMTITLDGGPREERCRRLGPLYLWTEGEAGNANGGAPPGTPAAAIAAIEAAPPILPNKLGFIERRLRERRVRQYGAMQARGAAAKPEGVDWAGVIAAFRPEVVYANSVASLPLLRRIPVSSDVPVVLHVHELRSYLLKYLKNDPVGLVRRPARHIACSEAVRQVLTRDCGVAASRIALVHEFVPMSDPWPPAETGGRRGGPLVVGGAGFPVWIKGGVLWVQAAAELLKLLGPDGVRFVYVGVAEEDFSWQLQEMARKLGVHPYVEWVGMTPDALSRYAELDVFISSSWEDPCPITVIENMMIGNVVCCFAGSGGAPEEVGDAGIVVEGFSPRAMAEAVATLAADPERRAALGRAARERARANFTDVVQAPRILEIFRTLARPSEGGAEAPREPRTPAAPALR